MSKRLIIPANYPFANVIDEVSDSDTMLAGEDFEHYLSVGISAVQNVEHAVRMSGAEVLSILDIPCGFGRVARALRAAYPKAEFHVCDIDPDGVRFCANTFGAEGFYSQPDFNLMNFGHEFDVIWVGSLITHLPPDATRDFARFVLRHLTPRGVAVVSSHGAFVAGKIQSHLTQGEEAYGTQNADGWRMLSDYFRLGYGYADYPGVDLRVQHYGVSLATRDWMRATILLAGGEVLFHLDHGWDNHHDVVAFKRAL